MPCNRAARAAGLGTRIVAGVGTLDAMAGESGLRAPGEAAPRLEAGTAPAPAQPTPPAPGPPPGTPQRSGSVPPQVQQPRVPPGSLATDSSGGSGSTGLRQQRPLLSGSDATATGSSGSAAPDPGRLRRRDRLGTPPAQPHRARSGSVTASGVGSGLPCNRLGNPPAQCRNGSGSGSSGSRSGWRAPVQATATGAAPAQGPRERGPASATASGSAPLQPHGLGLRHHLGCWRGWCVVHRPRLLGDVHGGVVLGSLLGHCQAFFSATSTLRMLMGCTGAVLLLASAGAAPAAAILLTISIPEVILPKIE